MSDFVDELSGMLSEERVMRAKKEAEKELFKIKLSELRKNTNLTQSEIEGFSQSGISKIEKRKDLKISTLIDYLEGLGLNLEINVYPKTNNNKKIVLLKTN